MYSLGCIIYELFTFHQYNADKMNNDIQEIDSVYDPKWQELIDSLLAEDPNDRLDIGEVFTKYLD